MNTDIYKNLINLQQTLYTSSNPTRRWLHTIRKEWIIGKINQYGGDRDTIALEVGPGSGIYIPFLLDAAARVMVSDCQPAYLNYIETQFRPGKIELIQDDITHSRIPAESIGLILFTEVIEHIKNAKDALEGLYRVLKPGGIVILTTPQRFSTLEICSKVAYLPGIIDMVSTIYGEPILDAGHINLMTEKKIKNHIVSVGFKIVEHHKSGLYMPLIAEFSGNTGRNLAQRLEKKLQNSPLEIFLWTQYYILKKPVNP